MLVPAVWRLGLIAVVLLAALLRLYGLDTQSLWLNELDSWWISQHDEIGVILGRGVMEDLHPPGYQLLLYWVIHNLGDSETVLRLPSVVAGVLSVYVMILLGARLYDAATGLMAGALLACLWAPIYYSQEARSYALLLLASVTATSYLVKIFQQSEREGSATWRVRLAYVLWATLACYLHYFGLVLVGFHVVVTGIRIGLTRQTLGIFASVALLYTPWLPSMWVDMHVTEHWIPRPGPWSWLGFYTFAFNNSRTMACGIAAPLYLLVCARAMRDIARAGRVPRPWRRDATVLLILWILIPLGFVYLKSQYTAPV